MNDNLKKIQYIFGPVPSRRLGRSLGVDLVPFKTCSYDCIYCQLGRTTCKTIQQQEWLPFDEIIRQLKEKLHLKPDYITLSGSGEPTLYSRCGEMIRKIKEITQIPVAVLTNGSLLWMSQARESLMDADLVIPSLDAGNDALFHYVNRPHPDITFNKMLEGLIAFRKEYKRNYWLEVFLLGGISTTEKEIENLKMAIDSIHPDKVQINTVTRPPAERYAVSVPKPQLEKLALQLSCNAEIISEYRDTDQCHSFLSQQEDVLALLYRRPCTIGDVAAGLGIHRNEAIKIIDTLLENGKITATLNSELNSYYSITLNSRKA